MSVLNEIIPEFVSNSYNELFGKESVSDGNSNGEISKSVMEMEFSKMKSFPGHIFQLYKGQQLEDMVESIRQFGILLPIILWQKDSSHIILSGHNRVNAAKIAGLTKGPVVIKENLTQEDAILIVTETNLRQRSFADLLHSERALCLSQHYEAMKCQGKRNDIINEIGTFLNLHDNRVSGTSAELQRKLENKDKIGQEYGLSRDKVAKYIRLATLIPALLSYVDTGEIAFLAAYDLSFISDKDKQKIIAYKIKNSDYKVDMKIAALLREYHENKKLTEIAIEQIMSGEKSRKPKSDKPKPFQLKSDVVGKYFTEGQSKAEIEKTIEEALAQYFSKISP